MGGEGSELGIMSVLHRSPPAELPKGANRGYGVFRSAIGCAVINEEIWAFFGLRISNPIEIQEGSRQSAIAADS